MIFWICYPYLGKIYEKQGGSYRWLIGHIDHWCSLPMLPDHTKAECGKCLLTNQLNLLLYCLLVVCWSLTSLCHSNGHIETMPAREINPFTALTRIRSQFLRTQWSTSNHSEWTRQRIRPLSHRGWLLLYWDKTNEGHYVIGNMWLSGSLVCVC